MASFEQLTRMLEDRGFSPEVDKAIRNAKICIADDRLSDLEAFVDGLKANGFTNIVEREYIDSVNELLDEEYDLIILDLTGVAKNEIKNDGIGVLSALKRKAPWLPVLVVSGTRPTPEDAKVLSLADAIRNKPLLPNDLVVEVEELLKTKMDCHWGGLAVLREIRKLSPDIAEKLGWKDRLLLWWAQRKLIDDIERRNPDTGARILQIANILHQLGSAAVQITKLAKGLK